MCAPTALVPVKAADAKERSMLRWVVVMLVALYFYPALFHVIMEVKPRRGLLSTPSSAMRLDVMRSTTTKFRWKRDGGFYVESMLDMRIHNDLYAPLKVKSINMTAAFPVVGAPGNFAAGYQLISGFSAGPRGSSTMRVSYILNDLRFSMLLAVLRDLALNAYQRRPFALQTHSNGEVFLWYVSLSQFLTSL